MPSISWKAALAGVAVITLTGIAVAHAASEAETAPRLMHDMKAGMGHGMGPGMMSGGGMVMGHDSATMAQLATIHELFANHDRIRRAVTNLPDGIRTTTESDDPHIAQLLKEHVASMRQRVDAGSDPGLPIESDSLHAIFRNHDKVRTTVETTAKGVVVTQTSADRETVAFLQQHASEVSDFVAQGMVAMRTAMMKKMGGMMPAGMTMGGMRGMRHGVAGHPGTGHAPEN